LKAALQKMGAVLNKRMGIIKALFVFSVLLFVITEVGKIAKEVSGEQLANALASQSWWHLLSMVVIGIIAVSYVYIGVTAIIPISTILRKP